jgi:regulatory protein
MSDDLRARALQLLARREYSRTQLREKLLAHAGVEEVDALLDRLEAAGLLSDRRFVESYVASRRGRYGLLRLRHELRRKGVAEALIAEMLTAEPADEFEQARALWQRKFALPPADSREYARQARFLQSRGFAGDVLKRILRQREQ